MAGFSPEFQQRGARTKKAFNPRLPEGPDNQRDDQPSDDDLIGMINQQNQDDMDKMPASPSPSASASPAPEASPLKKMKMPAKKKPEDEDVW